MNSSSPHPKAPSSSEEAHFSSERAHFSSENASSPPFDLRQGGIVFFFSLGLLLYELCLTRVLSVFFYYHTAFFAVSLAMLGIGVGGVWVYLVPRRFSRGIGAWMATAALFVAALPVVLALLRFDHAYLQQLWSGPLLLVFGVVASLCLLPFLAGGVVWAWWFRTYREKSAQLYGWDLLGAAVGALLVVPCMEWFGGPGSVLLCALVLFACAAANAHRQKRHRLFRISVLCAAGACALLASQLRWDLLALQIDADPADNRQKTRVLFKKWNAFSRVVLLKGKTWFRALSDERRRFWRGKTPEQLHALIDTNAFAPFVRFDGDLQKVAFLRELVSNLAYHLLPRGRRVLVLGPGGGKDILAALTFAPRQVVGIEINPILVRDLALGKLRNFLGDLYRHPLGQGFCSVASVSGSAVGVPSRTPSVPSSAGWRAPRGSSSSPV